MGQKKLTCSEVVSGINRIVDSLGRLASTTIKYESPLQALVQAVLEWIEPLQADLAAEERAPPKNKPFPVTSLDNSIRGASLDWEQVQEKEARSKTTSEYVPAGRTLL